MNTRQQNFCREYLVDANATQAAIRSGYSKKTARQQGTRLLADVAIAERIRRLNRARLTKLDITADKVLQEIAAIAFANIGDYMVVGADGSPVFDLSGLGATQLAALAEVTVEESNDVQSVKGRVRRTKIKLHNKIAALTLLAKHLNLLKPKDDDETETPAMRFVRALSGRMIVPRQLPPEAKRLSSA